MNKRNQAVSGFTFIKNGLTLGYPIKESILSIEPFCDEIIINVGFDDPECRKDDGTYSYLRDFFPQKKYIFLKNTWNPQLKKDGVILAQQTNLALERCQGKYCQYIQGDEVIHENDLDLIQNGLNQMEGNSAIEGLVFNYLHFYGNVNIIKHTRNTYRREVRLIRNHLKIKSWKDAQGFRKNDDSKLNCIKIPARIFHYGWARKSPVMKNKILAMNRLYHGDQDCNSQEFEYRKIWGLKKFLSTHPQVMEEWIEINKNDVEILNNKTQWERRNIGLAISDWVEKITDYRIGEYKNYKLL